MEQKRLEFDIDALERKVQTAIERIKMASDMSFRYFDKPLYICISGGKDSSAITQLAIESRRDVIFSHSHTTVDAPETVYFVRSEMDRLKALGYKTQILYPKKSMWQLIEGKKGMPPTRLMRYCCSYFKERNVSNDKKAFIVTGVRWAESANRKNSREEFEVCAAKKADAIKVKANDNDLDRKLFEECKLKGERICRWEGAFRVLD